MSIQIHKKLSLRGEVDVWGWDAKQVPTFEDYIKLKKRDVLDKYAIYHDKGKNLVVNSGLNQLILLLNGGSATSFPSCGVGSGTNAVLATDTDLQTAITRISVTAIYQAANVGHWDTFFNNSTGTGTWNEAGLFSTNTLASGIMLCRKLLASSFPKTTSVTSTVAWTLTATAV